MKNNPDNNIIMQPKSHTQEEMFGNWEAALKRNSMGLARGKKVVWVLVASFLIDILLTTGFFYNTIQTREAAQQAAIATCISGNKARADNRYLWDHVISLNKIASTPGVIQFEKDLDAATKPRACK